jgi:hypothetical protein
VKSLVIWNWWIGSAAIVSQSIGFALLSRIVSNVQLRL